MLFLATIVGFVVIRVQLRGVWPPDLPGLPPVLWISTAVLGLSSVTHQAALNGIRRGRADRLRGAMWMTTALAVMFLALQSAAWWAWLGVASSRWSESAEHRFALTSFYIMTGLHALHVIGGLVPMAIVTIRASRRRYTAEQHPGVAYCAMYWHFLGAVWIVLYATLLIGT
jgi:cytochrome c oxidase subunit 3